MSTGKIKTALEKALERAAALPEVSAEELKRMEYIPQGQALAGKFINNNTDIASELAKISSDALPHVKQGFEDTLLKNIALPEDESTMQTNKQALEGFYHIKEDKQSLIQIAGELEYLFSYYQQAVEQTKASLKAQLAQKFQAARQQIDAQYGGQIDFDLEKQPEFRNELLKILGQLNQRFEGTLQEAKEKLKALN